MFNWIKINRFLATMDQNSLKEIYGQSTDT